MMSEGLAKVVKYEPNVKYVEEFYKLQDEARKRALLKDSERMPD